MAFFRSRLSSFAHLVFCCLLLGFNSQLIFPQDDTRVAAGPDKWLKSSGLVGLPELDTTFAPSAAFTAGNIVVYRVGNGVASLNSNAAAVFLDEYSPAGTLVQSIAMPTTVSGADKRLTASGTATSEGFLTRSVNGEYLLLAGYDVAVGTGSITTSTSASINRVIGRVDSSGAIDTSTALSDAISGGNPRSAASTNGTDLWISGNSSGGGIRYTTLGATTSTQISSTPTNLRVLGIFDGQLFLSSNTGAFHLSTVGVGTPTTSGQTITNLSGFPITGSHYGFYFADLSPIVSGIDTLYIAEDTANQIQKYSLVGGNWTSNGAISLSFVRGLTAVVVGTSVTLYVTAGSSTTTLQTLTDTSGYNATITGTLSTLATAAASTAFRGVALAPVSPSAAGVGIAGRVHTADGIGLGRVWVTVTGPGLDVPRRALTNPFGYYAVDDLDAGATYIVTVDSKQYAFAESSRVVTLGDAVTDIDFIANPLP